MKIDERVRKLIGRYFSSITPDEKAFNEIQLAAREMNEFANDKKIHPLAMMQFMVNVVHSMIARGDNEGVSIFLTTLSLLEANAVFKKEKEEVDAAKEELIECLENDDFVEEN